jgi:hypothetical protein
MIHSASSVQFSNDNGATWRTLRVNEGSFSFTAIHASCGCLQCLVRVIASDGFNSATGHERGLRVAGPRAGAFIGGVATDNACLSARPHPCSFRT